MKGLYEKLQIPDSQRNTSIKAYEGEYIFEFVRSHLISCSLETGLAYGCSAAYILAGTEAPHVAIDPYQQGYDNLGLRNLSALGFETRLELIAQPSHCALPRLLQRGTSIDFAFVDGGHLFDEIFIDWYYIDLLLKPSGHVLFHDTWLKSTQAVAAFIKKNRREYKEINQPIRNFFLFQKTGRDTRDRTNFPDSYHSPF